MRLAGSIIKSVAYLFVAKQLTFGEAAPEEDEEIVLKKIPLSQAVEKVLSNKINKATAMVGILTIDKLREQGKL